MGEIVNLRRARKRRERDRKAEQAAEMRLLHGRSRAERDAQASRQALARDMLDGARLDPPPGEDESWPSV